MTEGQVQRVPAIAGARPPRDLIWTARGGHEESTTTAQEAPQPAPHRALIPRKSKGVGHKEGGGRPHLTKNLGRELVRRGAPVGHYVEHLPELVVDSGSRQCRGTRGPDDGGWIAKEGTSVVALREGARFVEVQILISP